MEENYSLTDEQLKKAEAFLLKCEKEFLEQVKAGTLHSVSECPVKGCIELSSDKRKIVELMCECKIADLEMRLTGEIHKLWDDQPVHRFIQSTEEKEKPKAKE